MSDIKPLDVILVRGTSLFATLIAYTQALKLHSPPKETYSHVGIVISRDIVDDEKLEHGKLYIWESCLSQGVYSVHHPDRKYLGTQVRPLEETLELYNKKAPPSRVGWLTLRNDLRPEFTPEFRRKFTKFYKEHLNVIYDANPLSLCGAVFSKLRPVARMTQLITGTEHLLFCSELVSKTLQYCKIIPNTINTSTVLPQDFLGYDDEEDMIQRIPTDIFLPLNKLD